jgi:succinate dehydrogenase assembly factor 2
VSHHLRRRYAWPHTRIVISHNLAMSTSPSQPLGEGLDTLRARLTYRSRKRGILETDLLLSTFAKDHLPSMTEAELVEYSQVSGLGDVDG